MAIIAKLRCAAVMETRYGDNEHFPPRPDEGLGRGGTKTGRYGNSSDYVRDLTRKDQEREAWIADTQKLIDEGLASGVSTRSMAEILEDARAEAAARRSNEL